MTTKITLILLASWALVFGVEHLGARFITFPGAHGSPVTQKESTQESLQSQVNSFQADPIIGKGQGGHGLPSKAPASRSSHRVKTRQASYDSDYEDVSQPYLGPIAFSMKCPRDHFYHLVIPRESVKLLAYLPIGCTFSKSLCDSNEEWCFNDYALGRCLKIYKAPEPSQLYRYALTKEDSHSLEKEMERLYSLGYRWGHAYTQCILQNSLDAIRLGTSWDTSMCADLVDTDLEGAMNAFQDDIDPMNLAFVKFTPSQNNPHADFADELYRPPSAPIQTSAVSSPVYEKLSSASSPAKSSIKMKFVPERSPAVNDIKSQLKALPARQELNSIPEGPEEELLEEAIAEYVARTGQRHKWNPQEKRAYPYYTSYRQPVSFEDEVERTDADMSNDLEEERRLAQVEATKELQEEIEVEILLRTLAETAQLAAATKAADRSLWQNSPQQPHIGPVDDDMRVLQDVRKEEEEEEEEEALTKPRIFSTVYNTPNLFRLGIETKDPESAMFAVALEEAAAEDADPRDQGEFQDVPVALPLVDANTWDETAARPEFSYVNNNEDETRPERIDPPVTFDDKPLYTEGGLVYLNNNPKRRFVIDFDGINSNGNNGRRNSGFERHERLDVKKPGPWYRTVNNFGFDYDEKLGNPEFASNEGPADMLPASNTANGYQDDSNEASVRTAKNVNPLPLIQNQLVTRKISPKDVDEEVTADKKSSFANKLAPSDGALTDHVEVIDKNQVTVVVEEIVNYSLANDFRNAVADALEIRPSELSALTFNGSDIRFHVVDNEKDLNATEVAAQIASRTLRSKIASDTGIHVVSTFAGQSTESPIIGILSADYPHRYLFITFFLALLVISLIVAALTLYLIRRQAKQHEKIARLSQDDAGVESCKDYQDLCRARMASKNNEKVEPIKAVQRVASTLSRGSEDGNTSSRSSTSSWSEEPVLTNMDISTGHMVLSYMEDHLKNKDRLDQEWGALCAYEADPCNTSIAEKPDNMKKNRFTNSLPYDHSRVILNDLANISGSDYINASTITDHDPRNPAYIATQGPLANTSADFWQMVWEQGSVVIVTLTRLADNGTPLCHRYWPEEGSELHHIYEVHLVSEHIWCDEYLVRSFYLKNLKTGETRTVTQFHFQAWPENNIPSSTKAILEFRRKVNKSYRGRSCPIIVHCSDGAGRTGTYCLIDMVLNRMAKGAKEIDIAASLEHIRDQRPGMVRTKQQFEFVLMAVAEEVHAILKALPQ